MDKYDRAIAYLTERPWDIEKAWGNPTQHPGGCLFQFMTPDHRTLQRPDGEACGCPTMISRNTGMVAWTDEMTAKIRADNRIPASVSLVQLAHLPVFAEYQREADRTFRQPAVAGEAR